LPEEVRGQGDDQVPTGEDLAPGQVVIDVEQLCEQDAAPLALSGSTASRS
jgi:hypothetical protein